MRARYILFIISLMLLSVVMVFGQEEPTPIPTEPPTELPTQVPSETFTPSPLPPPPTEISTEVPTQAPSETFTPSPLPLPSDTPTIAPTDPPTQTATQTLPSETSTLPPSESETLTATVIETATPTPTATGSSVVIETPVETESPPTPMVPTPTSDAMIAPFALAAVQFVDSRTYVGSDFAVIAPADVASFATLPITPPCTLSVPYEIYLLEGTYVLDRPITISCNTMIFGRGANISVIQQADSSVTTWNQMLIVNSPAILELHNLTVTDGYSRNNAGAILVWDFATLRVYDSIFTNNEARENGGAIYAQGSTVRLERSIFSNNHAWNSGGAVHVIGYNPVFGNLSGACVDFVGNRADAYRGTTHGGGAIYVAQTNVTINGSSFRSSSSSTTGIGRHIFRYPFGGTTIDATHNYWEDPAIDLDAIPHGIDASAPEPNAPSCPMNPPIPVRQPPTPTPTSTPTATATYTPSPTPTLEPNELAYYQRFTGLIFWAIYNETSENTMEEQFDLVETAVASSEPEGSNRVVSVPNLADYQGEARENLRLRYLFARLILENVPQYSFVIGNETSGFLGGFAFGRRWGGSINNPNNNLWDAYEGCPDTHGYSLTLDTYRTAHTVGGQRALDWLSDYALCQSTSEAYQDDYQQILADIDRAIEHHIRGRVNPIGDASEIRNANTCFWVRDDGGCAYVREVPTLCSTPGTTCDPLSRYVEGSPSIDIAAEVFIQWRTAYDSLAPEYRNPTLESYLYSTKNLADNTLVEQITYNTRLNYRYSVSVGLRQPQSRYILMGVGGVPYYSEDIYGAFLRHWNRLNRDQNPVTSPETYRPNFCLTGMIHATFGSGIFQTWTTFTFQTQRYVNPNVDVWFCEG